MGVPCVCHGSATKCLERATNMLWKCDACKTHVQCMSYGCAMDAPWVGALWVCLDCVMDVACNVLCMCMRWGCDGCAMGALCVCHGFAMGIKYGSTRLDLAWLAGGGSIFRLCWTGAGRGRRRTAARHVEIADVEVPLVPGPLIYGPNAISCTTAVFYLFMCILVSRSVVLRNSVSHA